VQDIPTTGVLNMSSDNQPALRVYSVIPREGKEDFWLNIGLAFPHGDGKGFNVMLQALPLDAKLVLREAAEEEQANARSESGDRTERRSEGRDAKTASAGRFRR
jgi:hypothetical protein